MSELIRATPAARALARHLDLDLNSIQGTGVNGRIQRADVQNFQDQAQPRISPLALAIAEDAGLDISGIVGTGYRGKIMRADVEAALANGSAQTAAPTANKPAASAAPAATAPAAEPASSATPTTTAEAPAELKDETVALSPMRKVISKRMSESYFLAPTVTLNYEIDMSELVDLRKRLIDPIMQRIGMKITFTDLIALATIQTLARPEHRKVNASLNADASAIEYHKDVNLALAVGLENGLVTPVLRQAQNLSLTEIVAGLKDLAKRAQENKLSGADMAGSTFTISNLGMFGVESFNPIINQPNSAILGVSASVNRPWVVDGEICIRPIMKLSLTFDHRIIDGMDAAKFMQDLKRNLESPLGMLI